MCTGLDNDEATSARIAPASTLASPAVCSSLACRYAGDRPCCAIFEHVTGVPTITPCWRRRRRELPLEAVARDEQARLLLPPLEALLDRGAENSIPSPDDPASEFEGFLRRRRDEPPES